MEPLTQILTGLADAPRRRLADTIYARLLSAIVEKRLVPGVRLPSSRQLASDYSISRNTAINVYARLTSEGYIESKAGNGAFVVQAETPTGLSVVPQSYDLALKHINPYWRTSQVFDFAAINVKFDFLPGLPDVSAFPSQAWRRLCARSAREYRTGATTYAQTQGREGLRHAISRHVSLSRAVACTPENLLVTAGTQQSLDILCRIFVKPGQTTVAVENPGYTFAKRAFEQAGARIVPIPVDDEGMIVGMIPVDIDLIYVTPSHQFPMSVVMSPRRRRELLNLAAEAGALILEDDYQAEFPVKGKPADALQSLDQSGCVFYLGTFSKCMFPELRLGYIAPPKWAFASLLSAKQFMCHETPQLEQDALAAFILEGHLARYVRKVSAIYAKKREVAVRALWKHCRDSVRRIANEGAVFLTVEFREQVNCTDVVRLGRANGLRLISTNSMWMGEKPLNGLVLGLGGISSDDLERGIEALALNIRRARLDRAF